VRLVDDAQPVFGEVVEERVGRLARLPAVDVTRVILDPGAEPELPKHLQIVVGAHPQALCLEELSL
jgi:hypothetical protein